MSVADESGYYRHVEPDAAPTAAPDAVADPLTESVDGTTGDPDPSNTPVEQLVTDLDPDDDVLTQIQGVQAGTPDAG